MDEFELELKLEFLQEVRELLAATEQSFLALEKEPKNNLLIDTIFRFTHNLKGTASAVGFKQIVELAHKAENLMLEIKQQKILATDEVVSVLLNFNDKVKEMIDGLSSDVEAVFDCERLLSDLRRISESKSTTPIIGILGINQSVELSGTSPVTDEEGWDQHPLSEVKPLFVHKAAPHPLVSRHTNKDETLRVSVKRLEKLNNLVGELVILQTVIDSLLSSAGEVKIADSFGKLCKDIQDLSMSLRLIQIGPTFHKLSRIVRDTSIILGKKIDLKILGEDTEVDRGIVESLGSSLVHIIRNAIDHGIESPEERISNGKPEAGVVKVQAYHEGHFLIIEITDDGKGIDGEHLVKKAIAKGIITPDLRLTKQQAIDLIFHPGLSTKEEVSEVSGRGVGMDVVKTNISELGGEIKVSSKTDQGSSFKLILPMALATIDGILVRSGSQKLVIPRAQIQEIIKIKENSVTTGVGSKTYLDLGKEVIPLLNLEENLEFTTETISSGMALVVKHNDHTFAVAIDDIIQHQQVVVNPIITGMFNKQGVIGTTILEDGKPSLIIDLVKLFSLRLKDENVAREVPKTA